MQTKGITLIQISDLKQNIKFRIGVLKLLRMGCTSLVFIPFDVRNYCQKEMGVIVNDCTLI